jgi:D-alanine-D-alanine ligase
MTQAAPAKRDRYVVTEAGEFGRVAVFYGGFSSERDVSLESGRAVTDALCERGVDAVAWDPAERSFAEFAAAGFDRAWIALHGPGGEDGTLQGALDWLGIPYSGSSVLASALAMDKIRAKHLFRAAALPTPEFLIVEDSDDAARALDALGLPMVLKPVGQGSSVGIARVFESSELQAACELALGYGEPALAERCIVGDELTVTILNGEALPSIRIETPRAFYDYRAKYESDRTIYHCPGSRDQEDEARLGHLALAAFEALGCSGWGRVDFMRGAEGDLHILEVNTVPGMTSHSLVPMSAREVGIDFGELCWRILETSFGSEAGGKHSGTAPGGGGAPVTAAREVANGS